MIIIIISKTIQTLTNYYDIINRISTSTTGEFTKEDDYCISNLEIDLAKSIIHDFDITSAKKTANIILSALS